MRCKFANIFGIINDAIFIYCGSAGAEDSSKLRKPEIMADAAYAILCQDNLAYTGNFCRFH